MGTIGDEVYEMGSSGVKLLGSNPGSLLRSKSTRHETRCEAACEWLVLLKYGYTYQLLQGALTRQDTVFLSLCLCIFCSFVRLLMFCRVQQSLRWDVSQPEVIAVTMNWFRITWAEIWENLVYWARKKQWNGLQTRADKRCERKAHLHFVAGE